MVHSEEGSDIPLHLADETSPCASGDWRSPRTLPTKSARFVPRGDGVPRHRAAASGAGCDLRSQGLAHGFGDQQRLCRPAAGPALGHGPASRLFSHRCGKITG